MNKKFYGTLLLGTLLLGSTIVSCKDYDDDIDNLQNQITQLATKAEMQSEVAKLESAVATAQAAAENKAAAAEKAAKDAEATAKAAAEAAAKAQGSADAAATVEALNKVAADAAAAAQAAEEAKVAAEAKAAELEAALAELKAFSATLVSTEDFEAAKKELNDKFAALQESVQGGMGTLGLTGLSLVNTPNINVGYGIWKGVHEGSQASTWNGPKKAVVESLENGTYLSAFGTPKVEFSVNPIDFDVTNTQFAVVNKYGEIAPIAFGEPKAVTRGAGFYTMDVTAGNLSGEVIEKFKDEFKDNTATTGQDGTYATLVAGNIAAEFNTGFVTVTQNKNADKSENFNVTVKYDDIDGSVELVPSDPQYVYDSYIVRTSNGNAWEKKTMGAHDSLYYNVKYVNNTVTYNAENLKKAGLPKTLYFYVSQINLNGYIHNGIATVTFEAKAPAQAIEKDPVEIATIEHQAKINVFDKASGKMTDLQNFTISEATILEALGLTDKKSDEYIHYAHSTKTYTFGIPVYSNYNADNDETKVQMKKAYIGNVDELTVGANWDGSLTAKFVADYKYQDFEDEDAIQLEKLAIIPLTIVADDQTDGEAKVKYQINIPVQFKKISVEGMYKWKDTRIEITNLKAKKVVDISSFFEGVAESALNTSLFTAANLKFDNVTEKAADNSTIWPWTPNLTFDHYKPAVVVSGQLGEAYQNTLAEMREIGYPDETTKKANEKQLLLDYMNAVNTAQGSSTFQSQYAYIATVWGQDVYDWVLVKPTFYPDYNKATDISTFTGLGKFVVNPAASGVNATAIANSTYTVSGVQLSAAGRTIDLPAFEIETYTTTPATPSISLSYNKLYADYETGLKLSDIKYTPATSGEHLGTFELKDKYGYALQLTNGSGIAVASITDLTDGTNVIAAGDLTASPVGYTYVKGNTTPTAYALKLIVAASASEAKFIAGHKLEVVLNITDANRLYDGDDLDVTVKFELEVAAKL